jgi:hypothetical protein
MSITVNPPRIQVGSKFRENILCLVNSAGEPNNLLDYSLVNDSLHNLPVNRIFMNMSF